MENIISIYDLEPFLRLFVAAFLGWIIGLERETLGKNAGTRTFALVCLGAALFAIADGGSPQLVAVGIGFLGAGLIMFKDGHTDGLTTAASLWTSAALGVVVGQGYYGLGIFSALLVLMILFLLRMVHPDQWRGKK